jgi:phosphoribosyl 1,2-cyclic phosphate phosphodiesterase
MQSVEFRTRPELLVETDEGKFLIELSPDLRLQTARNKLASVDQYLLSHWHFDHLFGLYELHAWAELVLKKPLTIHCSGQANEYIQKHINFVPTNVQILSAYQPFMLEGVKITPIPVFHMYATDNGKQDTQLDNTFGFLLEHGGKKIAYLADYYKVPEQGKRLLKDADAIVCDGTYLFEEQYPNKPYQNAIREEKDPDHLHGQGIIDWATQVNAKAVVYHSISHLPEKTHQELQALLPENHMISYDGMTL